MQGSKIKLNLEGKKKQVSQQLNGGGYKNSQNIPSLIGNEKVIIDVLNALL